MLNCLAAAVPGRERIITCEEVFELSLPAADWVALQTRQPNLEGVGEIPLRRLVKEALRMRPDRLIVGEVRQGEALDLLIALNSGIPGMATLARQFRARSRDQAVHAAAPRRRQHLARFRGADGRQRRRSGRSSRQGRAGPRRVREIVGLSGRVEESASGAGVIELSQLYATDPAGPWCRADGFPPHPERYGWAGFDLIALLASDRRAA